MYRSGRKKILVPHQLENCRDDHQHAGCDGCHTTIPGQIEDAGSKTNNESKGCIRCDASDLIDALFG
jgi:hypothetical protein